MRPEDLRIATRVLVDTDVFSYIFKDDSRARPFQRYLLTRIPSISSMSVAELYFGAYKGGWGQGRIARLEGALKRFVVLPYDYVLCQTWATIRNEREREGRPISHADAWIAASALRHNCALATNNGKDYDGINGLVVINPSD